MSGLTVYSGNRLELLLDRLAEMVASSPPAVFATEVIVVQSREMARWLSMGLAQRCGVWANCRYPFPNAFLQELFQGLDPKLPETSPYSPEVLTFRIMGMLSACLDRPAYRPLKHYLERDVDGLKAFQLSAKIADTFDQYLVFRPEMILRWEARGEADDPDEKWQADLWRRLTAACGGLHRARLMQRLIAALAGQSDRPEALPERVSIFGIAYLPPSYLAVFAALARRVPVHFFLMNPCREYWGDILSKSESRSIVKRYGSGVESPGAAELFLERGNPLLASMGRMGRDFFDLLTGFDCETVDLFRQPPTDHLLGALQTDILELADRSAPGRAECAEFDAAGQAGAANPAGPTVQLHACHSPMREVEVLYDHLLAMLETDPTLTPRDICVMVPDIDAYAPVILAVFGAQSEDHPRIPFNVCDRSLRRESDVGEAFVSLLSFKDSRFGAAQVMTLLQSPPIQANFGLSDGELRKIDHWVRETRIRWGMDAASRGAMGLPEYPDNTWKAGLDRMLLGYVMPGGGREMFGNILPFDPIEGGDGQTLDKFMQFLDALEETARNLERPRRLSEWRSCLMAILERFFGLDDSSEAALHLIRKLAEELGDVEDAAQLEKELPLEPVRAFLTRRLEKEQLGNRFLAGGVTFCALLPMRSIPFRTICLLGLNSDSFPRDYRPPGFDLTARRPRPGDRSRRDDDKYLFLEAVVSARDRLYLSYVGRSVADNAPIPPSVLVSELLDYLRQGFGGSLRQYVTEHRLQPFSTAYFTGSRRLFSYSQENLEAAAVQLAPPLGPPPPFCAEGLSAPGDEWRRIDLDLLISFFRNPAKFLLRHRLGLSFGKDPALPEERENFEAQGLDRFQIVQELVETRLQGLQAQGLEEILRAQGRLPPGATGDAAFEEMRSAAESLVKRTAGLVEGRLPQRAFVEVELGGVVVGGAFDSLFPGGWVRIHPARDTGARQVDTWIRHLVRCAACEKGRGPKKTASYLVCSDKTWVFAAVEDSREILQALLGHYWAGLMRPIAFFPESALAYCEQTLLRGKDPDAGLEAARKKWEPGVFGGTPGECEDPYRDLCFGVSAGAAAPLNEDFARLAEAIYAPMLSCRREIS